MNDNNSQIGQIPSESVPSNNNNNSQETIIRLIANNNIITNQPTIELTRTNIVPTPIPIIRPVQNGIVLNRRQEGRRRRRQRQRQRRRQHLQEFPLQYHGFPRSRHEPRHNYIATTLYRPSQHFYEGTEWDHQQIEELEGFAALEQLLLIQDDLEQEQQIENVIQILEEHEADRYHHVQSQLQLYESTLEDNHEQYQQFENDQEQLQQIDHTQQVRQEELHERNEEELIQREQWEAVAFLIQQMNGK